MQCRINANRGPWQLFAQAPLLTRDKDLSQPATRVDTTWWQYFVSLSIWPIFIFCCRNYVKLLDYWRAEKNFSTSGGPLWPETRSICHIATWLIRHCLHGLWDLYALCRSSKKRSVPGTKKWRTACTTKLILFAAVIRLYLCDAATASSALSA